MTLPPLAAIRVFEAAARHLSFTRAAKELGMTQAAVSYQIDRRRAAGRPAHAWRRLGHAYRQFRA